MKSGIMHILKLLTVLIMCYQLNMYQCRGHRKPFRVLQHQSYDRSTEHIGQEVEQSDIIYPHTIPDREWLQNITHVNESDYINPQIIEGYAANRTQATFVVFLMTNKSVTCGATLISRNCILTAAHCVYKATSVDAYIGGILRFKLEYFEQYFKVNRTKVHERYDERTLAYDVALCFINKNVVLNVYASIMRLPRRNDLRNFWRMPCYSCGYGQLQNNGSYSSNLMCVELKVYTNRECMRYFKPSLIRNYTLCTMPGPKAICKGDSGGPLYIKDTDGIPTLIGVVSFVAVVKCSSYPNGFSRVTNFLDWIYANSNVVPR